MRFWIAFAALLLVAAGPARDVGSASGMRSPQPVRAGDLVGRKLIGPTEAQPLLGRIDAVAREADGGVALRVRTASLWPWGGRVVDVPLAAVALLGELVALMDLTDAQLDALPNAPPQPPLPPETTVSVGLVRPFH